MGLDEKIGQALNAEPRSIIRTPDGRVEVRRHEWYDYSARSIVRRIEFRKPLGPNLEWIEPEPVIEDWYRSDRPGSEWKLLRTYVENKDVDTCPNGCWTNGVSGFVNESCQEHGMPKEKTVEEKKEPKLEWKVKPSGVAGHASLALFVDGVQFGPSYECRLSNIESRKREMLNDYFACVRESGPVLFRVETDERDDDVTQSERDRTNTNFCAGPYGSAPMKPMTPPPPPPVEKEMSWPKFLAIEVATGASWLACAVVAFMWLRYYGVL